MQSVLQELPFNITLLVLNAENTRSLQPIRVLDIFDSASNKNFHPQGLFSTEIFGKVGDERRNRVFAYIDLKAEIFHPVIYKALIDLRGLYGEILAGTTYAVFNEETKDFDPATLENGETGFEFFMKHFQDLQFEERKSTSREFLIRLVNENRNKAVMNKIIVMPAGLRDYIVQPNGKPEEDEINGIYRKILSVSNLIGNHHHTSKKHLDGSRYSLQRAVYELYSYIINLLEGKGKLIQGWWASRNVSHSSRNVITSTVPHSEILDDPLTISVNHTVVGLYQTMMSIFPLAVNLVRNIITDIFTGPNTPARLVDKKTLMSELVNVDLMHYDTWMTQEGIETQFGRFESEPLRDEVIEIEGHYLALVYNDGKHVRIVHGLQDFPDGYDTKFLTPITYAELYYLAIQEAVKTLPVTVTRYPITGMGSIYPSYIYLKTTTRSQCLEVLDVNWEKTGHYASEFPIKGVSYVNSMSPSASHLGAAGADFDGDTFSFIPLFTEESKEEVTELLNSARYYVGIDGKMVYSVETDISALVFAELTS
jgi:hypothetical protein